jgi:hypothetical protein
MKKKVVNYSLTLLILTVLFGLFQAWKESKNPFMLFSNNNKSKIEKSKYSSNTEMKLDAKENYIFSPYLKRQHVNRNNHAKL